MGALSGGRWQHRCAGVTLPLWGMLALAAPDQAVPLLSDRPLFPAWLRVLEAELVISAESIEWQDHELREIHAPLKLAGGAARMRLAAGEIRIDATRSANGTSTLELHRLQRACAPLRWRRR